MKAYDINTGKEINPGEEIRIYKHLHIFGWSYSGRKGIFEGVTESGLINFIEDSKPRQCMPQGIGAIVK